MRRRRSRGVASKGTVVERMRRQMALKQVRARARELGIPVEAYLLQLDQGLARREQVQKISGASETLARQIVERMKTTPPPAPPPRTPSPDLQSIVDQILNKKPQGDKP